MFLFFWQLVGFNVFFQVERFQVRKDIKKAIKHSLPDKSYKEFNFTFKEFNQLAWINDHEFKMDGRMYDVVKKKKNDIGYSVSCIDDIQETVLFAKLDEATTSNLNNQPEKAPIKSFVKSFECNYILTEIIQSNHQLEYEINIIHNFHYEYLYAQFKVSEQIPPPDFFV
jgi:hypothetical protein